MGQKIKILIVEDEAIFAVSMQRLLAMSGKYVCKLVATGEAAVESAKQEKPDLAIMDVMLKGKLDGIEAAMDIRSLYDIPILFITGYEEEKLVERINSIDACSYLIKPILPKNLESAIKHALQ